MENQTTADTHGTDQPTTELTVTSAADILAAELAPTVAQLEIISRNYADVTTLDFNVPKNRTKLADADKELKKLKTSVNKNIETFKQFTKNLTAELVTRCDDLIKSIEAIRAPIEAKRTEIEAAEKERAAEKKRLEAAERAELEKFNERTQRLFDADAYLQRDKYHLNGVVFTVEQIRDMTDGEFNLLFDVANIDAPTVEPDDEVPPAAGCVDVPTESKLKPYQAQVIGRVIRESEPITDSTEPVDLDNTGVLRINTDVITGKFPAIESPGFEDCRQQVIQAIKAKQYKTMPELISIIEGLHPTTPCE